VNLSDSRDIRAPRADVWDAILDPEVLCACIPGCESMTGSVADGFEAAVVQKVGPVKARFTGIVSITDVIDGQSCRISGEGKGGPAGFAKGGATVRLEDIPDGTRLAYEVEANVGGKLAQLGSRIIDGFAKKLADDFFERFQSALEGPDETAPEDAAEPEKKKGWIKRLIG